MISQVLAKPQQRAKLCLLAIIAAFIVPLALAWWLVGLWLPAPTGQHGDLLNPARPLPQFSLHLSDGNTDGAEYLHGRWTLAYIGDPADCNQTCRTSLYDMRQVRLALGKDISRLQTLYMASELPQPVLQDWLDSEHASMAVAMFDTGLRTFFEHAFTEHDQHGIYLIDPLGNLVMRYSAGVDPSGILKDLKRLLKLSKIG